MVLNISGLYPPIPTPFLGNGDIDFESLKANLQKWEQIDLAGYVVMGSNGEVVMLDENERVQLIKFVRENTSRTKKIIGGAGCESTRQTIRMCKRMAAAGADAVLIINPHYYTGLMKDHSTIVKHYMAVADKSPAPLILYNMPGNTGIPLSAKLIIECASHPNIIGYKESGGKVATIAQVINDRPNFQVLAGSASFLAPGMAVGAVGGVCALANIASREILRMMAAVKAGDWKTAGEIQRRLVEPNAAVTSQFGIPGLKAALEMIGMKGGPVRSPLQDLGPEKRNEVRRILRKAKILSVSKY